MSLQILMVENDADDRILAADTAEAEGFHLKVQYIYGIDLPGWLEESNERPQLFLLSTNSQPYSGVEMTKKIRATPGFRTTPIVLLGESIIEKELREAYAAGATSFIQKPPSYSESLFKITTFYNYWFHTVALPEAVDA